MEKLTHVRNTYAPRYSPIRGQVAGSRAIAGLWRALTAEAYALKIRDYVREARKRRTAQAFFQAGVFYQRAASTALRAKRNPERYLEQALDCFEEDYVRSLSEEDYSQAADALERIAKIHALHGNTQLAADLRIHASYLRLKGIEVLMR